MENQETQVIDYNHWVQKLNELPTLPTIVYELSKIIADPMSSTREVESVMKNDQSLTMKVLKLVNSAYYAIPGGVSNLSRAIAFLGFDTVHQLVLSTSIIQTLKTDQQSAFDIKQFWQHSVGVSMAAETIAKHIKHRAPTDLFTCGLVHDIGKMALYILDSEMLTETAEYAKEEECALHEIEAEVGCPEHVRLGFELAKKWQLPIQIQLSIRYHHEIDPKKRVGCTGDLNNIIDIIYLANLLTHALKFGNSGYDKILPVSPEVFPRLGMKTTELPELAKLIKNAINNADGFLKIIGDAA